jgi:hypothetical protein
MTMLLMGAGTPTAGPLFAVATGQTLIAREYFDETVNSGNVGHLFSSVPNGQITGGVTHRGCIGLESDGVTPHASYSAGAFRRIWPAEDAANTCMFYGSRNITLSSGNFRVFLEGWFRFGRSHTSVKKRFMTYVDNSFPCTPGSGIGTGQDGLRGLQMAIASTGVTLYGGHAGSPADGTSSELPLETPIKIRFALQNVSSRFSWRGMYRLVNQSTMTTFWTGPSFDLGIGASPRIVLEQQAYANQGGMTGLVGALGYYSYASDIDAEGTADSTDIGDFHEARKTYEIIPGDGNDATLEGPWETPDGIVDQGWRNCAIVGFPLPWGAYGYSTLTTLQAHRDWAAAWYDNTRPTMGDTVLLRAELPYGVPHRCTKTIDPRFLDGLKIASDTDGYNAKISFMETFSGTWQQDSGNDNVWYLNSPGLTRAGIFIQDGSGALICLKPIRVEDKATALALLAGESNSCWTDGTDVYVNYGSNGDPSPYVFERLVSTLTASGDIRYMFREGNVHLRYLAIEAGYQWNASDGEPVEAHIPILMPIAANTADAVIMVADNIETYYTGKHAFSTASNQGRYGLVIQFKCTALAQAPDAHGADAGISYTKCFAFVDYSGGAVSNGTAAIFRKICSGDNGSICIPGSSSFGSSSGNLEYYAHTDGLALGTNYIALVRHDTCNLLNRADPSVETLAALFEEV